MVTTMSGEWGNDEASGGERNCDPTQGSQRHVSTSDRPASCAAVVVATALTDAVYVLFTNAVIRRHRLPAATWSSVWYLLSSLAVISYTNNWVYVLFAAMGSFIGAYATMTYLHPGPTFRPRRSVRRPTEHARRPEFAAKGGMPGYGT